MFCFGYHIIEEYRHAGYGLWKNNKMIKMIDVSICRRKMKETRIVSSLKGKVILAIKQRLFSGESVIFFLSFVEYFFSLFFLDFNYLFQRKRERRRPWVQRGEGESISQVDSTLSPEPDKGLSPTTMRSWPEPKPGVRLKEHLIKHCR